MKKISILFLICTGYLGIQAQIDAGLFRYPDVSKTQIVFTYANDLWLVPKDGGTAVRLSSPPGVESFPKFSPDGKTIAFSANYDGNQDVYAIPATGGIPVRLTEHGYPDRVVDWQPDGKRILFASIRESGKERFNQFYTVAPTGGPTEKLPLAYAEFGSYSPDGKQMALTFRSQVFRNWKRYRGGWNADIHIFNFTSLASENISASSDAADELPMWYDHYIYFLSDRGPEVRMNLWRYDLSNKTFQQITTYKDYDIHFPSLGPDDIVFEQGGKLFLFQLANQQVKEVKVNLVTDDMALKPKLESVQNYIQHTDISPDGNRAIFEARGDLFSLPAENGYIKNISRTSGSAERAPAWSPDGKTIAYWSDESGEYELYFKDLEKDTPPKKLTSYGPGFRYNLFWSPDSKKIAFIDKAMSIKIYDVTSNQTIDIDKGMRMTHGALEGFSCNWSPDSRWLTYSHDIGNYLQAVFLYDFQSKKLTQVTSGYYNCTNPVFDADGKYIFLLTNQTFRPYYGDLDNTFTYANSTQVAAIVLKESGSSVLYPKNDKVEIKKEDDTATAKKPEPPKDAKTEEKKPKVVPVDIDVAALESRLILLPIASGNYGNLAAVKGKILYIKYPNTGVDGGRGTIKFYDLDKREEKTVLDVADNFQLSASRTKMLVQRGNTFAILKPDEGQKFEKTLRIAEMEMVVDPPKEWKQIFMDTWRMERDYFYDPAMHGVDWNLVKERYLKMLNGAMTREEVNYVLGEMLGELNASHTYKGGGDEEETKSETVGYLGVDWQADGEYYKIKKIIRGAAWDAEARSPLDMPGVGIKEGNYILAVNGLPVTTAQEPYAFFQGLAYKTVEITYNTTASWTGAKTALVQTMNNEYRLRHLAWIESNRKRVDEETNGEAGYIFVPSTGVDGQNELIRQFSAQWDKKALVIDERFNNGGQIPDRFIEMLNRSPLAFWAIRDGATWPWPPFAHFGPKVMLINGWSGSGGDAFPDYFRKKGLGPLIGARTWGGLIGISGVPALIDNGGITVPSFRMYNPDGTWFKEGHGVDPDIQVDEDLTAMAKGTDPQLERAITEIKNLVKQKGFKQPERPAAEKRN
ncbi:MAG: peptidase S41 [Bacteroidetes bacterium]|nr:MAG: peptidase S41 [Bacteroidota bacterium]